MRYPFIDKYSAISSPVHTFDSRLKFILAVLCIAIIASEPKGRLYAMGIYAFLCAIFLFTSRIPVIFFFKRLLIILPFITLAAIFYPLSFMLSKEPVSTTTFQIALTIFLKAFLSLLLLLLLISSEKIHQLPATMQKIGLPSIIGTVASLMYRYLFILADEAMRTNTARKSRTPDKIKQKKIKVIGNQITMIFLRSWERSKTTYNAMLSRGFNGNFVSKKSDMIKTGDLAVFLFVLVLFLFIRFSKHLYMYFQ